LNKAIELCPFYKNSGSDVKQEKKCNEKLTGEIMIYN